MHLCHPITGIAAILLALVVGLATSALAQDRSSSDPVQLGDWTIKPSSFRVSDGFVWSGSAHHKDGNLIHISIYEKEPHWHIAQMHNSFYKRGVGTIKYLQGPGLLARQAPPPIDEYKAIRREFLAPTEQQFIRLYYTTQKFKLKPIMQDPALDLFKEMFKSQIILGRYNDVSQSPQIEASINDREFKSLHRASTRKVHNSAWELPAKPGQSVKLKVRLTINTYFIGTIKTDIEQSIQHPTRIELAKSGEILTMGEEEHTAIDIGKLSSPRMLTLHSFQWEGGQVSDTNTFLLRWGRPEEQWLNSCDFPLAAKPAEPTTENYIHNILHDLNIAFDPDQQGWLEVRGHYATYEPSMVDIVSLNRVDLQNYDKLNSLETEYPPQTWYSDFFGYLLYRKNLYPNNIYEQQSRNIAEIAITSIKNREGYPCLWENLSDSRKNSPSGWHAPHNVYGLAVLWERFPQFKAQNPLERILDYWVEAIEIDPDPVYYVHKFFVGYDPSMIRRGYAIAALHLGYQYFEKDEYAAARDVLLNRMEEIYTQNNMLPAMKNMTGWTDDYEHPVNIRQRNNICHAVSIYGQTSIFIGHTEGIRIAQNWIKAALARKGEQGKNPFDNYQDATFADRCGMLSILRNRAAYLTPPDEFY